MSQHQPQEALPDPALADLDPELVDINSDETPPATDDDAIASRRDLKAEAMSLRHLMTHEPKNKWCPICRRAKMMRKPAHRRRTVRKLVAKFGHRMTADHLYATSGRTAGVTGDKDILVIYDLGTDYLGAYPVKSKSTAEARNALVHFMGDSRIRRIHSDASPELARCMRSFNRIPIPHDQSTPGIPATTAIAESMVRRTIVGTRTNLYAAGLPTCFWPYAAHHYAFARNAAIRKGDSAWNKRKAAGHFNGPLVPFGALVHFMPSPTYRTRFPKMDATTIPGIFIGYQLHPGAVYRGEFLVAALADFAGVSLHRATGAERFNVHIQRIRELDVDKENGYQFPLRAKFLRDNQDIDALDARHAELTGDPPPPEEDDPPMDPPDDPPGLHVDEINPPSSDSDEDRLGPEMDSESSDPDDPPPELLGNLSPGLTMMPSALPRWSYLHRRLTLGRRLSPMCR